jgi:ferredoxin
MRHAPGFLGADPGRVRAVTSSEVSLMATRKIVKIDEDKCTGCGLCVTACAEAAIAIVDGKAKLISEIYCDGLGACLGHCPEGAITVEEREAEAFDEQATEQHIARANVPAPTPCACPGMATQQFAPADTDTAEGDVSSQLAQWPVQLNLISPQAAYFANADLLLVADCVPFAMGDFHSRFLMGHAIAIGCPKLDDTQYYTEKVQAVIDCNNLKSVTVIHMEVPCCTGLVQVTRQAILNSSKKMGYKDVTVSIKGEVLLEQDVAL